MSGGLGGFGTVIPEEFCGGEGEKRTKKERDRETEVDKHSQGSRGKARGSVTVTYTLWGDHRGTTNQSDNDGTTSFKGEGTLHMTGEKIKSILCFVFFKCSISTLYLMNMQFLCVSSQ